MDIKPGEIIDIEIRPEHMVIDLRNPHHCPGVRACAEAFGVPRSQVSLGYSVGTVRTTPGAVQSFSIRDHSAFSQMARCYDAEAFEECLNLLPLSICLAFKP